MVDFGEVQQFAEHWSRVFSKKLARQCGRPSEEDDFNSMLMAAAWKASQRADLNRNAKGFIYQSVVNKFREIARSYSCQKRTLERNHFQSLDESEDGYQKPLPKRLEVDYGNRVSVIRDYVDNLRSPYEREICERYLSGEELKTIAGAFNIRQRDLREDLVAALGELEHF